MKLILETHTSAIDDFGCSYALLDLSQELAWSILRKIKAIDLCEQDHPTLAYAAFYSGGNPDYFGDLEEEFPPLVGPDGATVQGIYIAPDDWQIADHAPARTECERLLIYPDNTLGMRQPRILFAVVPRHTDIDVETDYLPLWIIEHIADGKETYVPK